MTDVTTATRDEEAGQQLAAKPDLLIHVPAPYADSLGRLQEFIGQSISTLNSSVSAVVTFDSPDGYRLEESGAGNHAPIFVESTQQNGTADVVVMPYSLPAHASTSLVLPWVQNAKNYTGALKMAQACGARVCVMLGPEIDSLEGHAISRLVAPVLDGSVDLEMPAYSLGVYEGLLNSAILYPLTRSLYGRRVRYPLGFDIAMSSRMQSRMMACLARHHVESQEEWLPWPASEAAATAGINVGEATIGPRRLPPPEGLDVSTILSAVVGSLFADAEAKAANWQRMRESQSLSASTGHSGHEAQPPDVRGMVESFHLAERNLQEVWSLVLPPNSVLALRKMARLTATDFRFPDALWVRIVYDFLLAFRLRVISRTHLLGALTPLYLGWVASFVLETSQQQADADARVETLARAFEVDKPYLVARWRWPDRFNP